VAVPAPFDFTETDHPDTRLQFYAPLSGFGSIANVSREIAQYLVTNLSDVRVCNYSGGNEPDSLISSALGLAKSAPVGFFYGFPDFVPQFFFDHAYKVGGFVCEASEIPDHWPPICNRFDLIIVPSEFCRDVFRECGVTVPIEVVSHGLEEEFQPSSTILPPDNEFWFLNVFADRFGERKGAKELIRAFNREFEHEPHIKLRLHVDTPIETQKLIRKFNAAERVIVSDKTALSTEQLAGLYQRVHVTVHPTKGEGFGLIPLQSIACGTPVIAPIHTGMKDHLSPEYVIDVEVACIRPSFHNLGYMKDAGYICDEKDLQMCMRSAYINWKQEKTRVMDAQTLIRQQLSWQSVLSKLNVLLRPN